jgi:cytochrome P450
MADGSINPLVEEFLRFITPAMNMARVATRDVDFRGSAVKQGDCMQLYFAAANRDPAIFAEPHRFDPARAQPRNLAFGSGAHTCVGNALAKLEMRILFEEMHKRSLKLRLAGQPTRGRSTLINQLLHLPLAVH